MNDIDTILDQLREAPLPVGLASLDSAVLDALAARPARGRIGRPIGMVAIAALVAGMLGAIPGSNVQAVAAVGPLGSSSPLAPSSLLVGDL